MNHFDSQYISDLLFCAIHGAGIIFFLATGLYMLLVKRSIFNDNPQRQQLRHDVGVSFLCWSASYCCSLLITLLFGDNQQYTSHLSLLVDFALCAPTSMQMVYSITNRSETRYFLLLPNVIIGILSVALYIILENVMVVYVAVVYWDAMILFFLFIFIKQTKSYREYVLSEYSDLTNRDVLWLIHAVWFVAFYGFLYVASRLLHSTYILMFAYVLTWIVMAYFVYYIENLKPISEALRNDISASEKEIPTAELAGLDLLLRTECEEKMLFLQTDLTIANLADAIGSNRTYLWKHLSQKGLNFNTYINSLRIKYAKNLLQKTPNLTTKELAKSCGFGSESAFRRVFVDLCGCSISQFCAQIHNSGVQ